MTLDQMRKLWPIAKLLHEARQQIAPTALGGQAWPEWTPAYPHNPIAFVDIALAQAAAVEPVVDALAAIERSTDYGGDGDDRPLMRAARAALAKVTP
ncbi:MAG TPA: hypothetical protein VN663_22690 [Ramlibacter sp.]|nr:hypothetical protein [Ramlibacter sp.]